MRNRCVIVLDENKPALFKNYSFYEKDIPIPYIIEIDTIANNHVLEEIEVISKRKKKVMPDIPIRENLLANTNELINSLHKLGIDTRLELNAEYILNYILYKHNLKEGTAKFVTARRDNSISKEDLLINYSALFKDVVIYRDVETRNKNIGLTSNSLMPIDDGTFTSTLTHAGIRALNFSNKMIDSLNEGGGNTGFDTDNAADNAAINAANDYTADNAAKVQDNYDINPISGVVHKNNLPDYVVEFVNHTSLADIGETSPSYRFMRFMGYSESKEFYSVDYSKKTLPSSDDYRRTLYWNPNVKTDELGKAKIEFYNNSRCKDLNIDAQTITLKGEVGVYEKEGLR